MLCAVSLIAWTGAARAADQEKPPSAPSLDTPREDDDDPNASPPRSDLEERIDELERKLEEAEAASLQKSPLTIRGYIDVGFFASRGNQGAGWVRDFANQQFPQYQDYAWTFLGDILATAINSRGEVADLGDAPGVVRFDSVDSNGAPSFIANEVNLRLDYQLSDAAIARVSLNFVPRDGDEDFSLGDFFDLDLAELEYVLTDDGNTSIFAGKMLPVFGIEYKERKSDQRFGITPSLVARYTTGSQLGLKIRSKLFDDWLIVAAALSNNSSTTEQFHFYREIDENSGKTASGRIAISIPMSAIFGGLFGDTLEIGGSGEVGPQDRASDSDGLMWFAGADLTYASADFSLKAQWIRGEAPGEMSARVWGLKLRNSGYVELDWQIFAQFGVLARAEMRDAIVTLGDERLYLTKSSRFTGGARVVFNQHVMMKAEYLLNREFGGIREFPNDVFTSSLVLSY